MSLRTLRELILEALLGTLLGAGSLREKTIRRRHVPRSWEDAAHSIRMSMFGQEGAGSLRLRLDDEMTTGNHRGVQ